MKRLMGVLLLVTAVSAVADAQTYSIPRKINLEPAVRREFRKWFVTPARYPGLIPEGFFPIGWSKDGKFAYYVEPVDEACGCYFARLVIQDMVTDDVLYEFKYNQGDDTDPKTGDMRGPGNIRSLWQKNQELFSDKLRAHAIVAGSSVLLGKTFTSGIVYTAGVMITTDKNEYDETRVMKVFFTLNTRRQGAKTLASIDHTKDEYNGTLDAGVVGVIKSPFEARVAVIGMEINRGWEGPPHTGDVRITGASLNFK